MTRQPDLHTRMAFLAETLELAGLELRNRFGSRLEVSRKKDLSFVTSADLASEKVIIDRIMMYFPKDSIWSEEAGLWHSNHAVGTRVWVVDPLDGTTNYLNNYPFYAVSIACGTVQAGGQILVDLGGIEDPARSDRYLALRGSGSTVNGSPIRIAEHRALEACFLCTGFGYKRGGELSADINKFAEISDRCQSIRRDGAAALDLALVARGVYDCFWESGLAPWDVAAGSLLVSEAGGSVINYPRRKVADFVIEDGSIIAGNSATVKDISTMMEN